MTFFLHVMHNSDNNYSRDPFFALRFSALDFPRLNGKACFFVSGICLSGTHVMSAITERKRHRAYGQRARSGTKTKFSSLVKGASPRFW